MTTQIQIPDEQWSGLVGAAVLQSITEENRDTLIKEAVTYLLTKNDNYTSYGQHRSPLQAAFDTAMSEAARKYIMENLEEQLLPKIKEVLDESLVKAFDSERKVTLTSNIADAIVKAFRIDDRY